MKYFLESHTNDYNISIVLAALFKKCIASFFSCAKKYEIWPYVYATVLQKILNIEI